MNKFIVSSSPFVHNKTDVNKMFLYTSIALVIPSVFAVTAFGFSSLLILLISFLTCFLSECLYNLITQKKFKIDNFSFFVTALVLALTLPIKTPYLVVVFCSFFSIFVVKMAFGGLGRNCFNPALAGRCLAGVIVPAIAGELSNVVIYGEEFVSLTAGGSNSLTNLMLGQAVGGIGTTSILIILLCACALIYLRIIDFKIPLFSIVSYLIVGIAISGFNNAMINLMSGSFIFVSVFVMTDPNTSPNTFIGKIIYSCVFGALSALLWQTGLLGENTIFAVALFTNLLVPYLDHYLSIRPLSLGGFRNAFKN